MEVGFYFCQKGATTNNNNIKLLKEISIKEGQST